MTKRTPSPWTLESGRAVGSVIAEVGDYSITAPDDVHDWSNNFVEQADAEFIVRACNAHDELLEACKLLLSGADDYQTGVAEAEAAIAKATGGGND